MSYSMLSLKRKVKKLIAPSKKLKATMKKLSSIHLLPSCCCLIIPPPKSKSTIPVESDEKGPPWGGSTTQHFPTIFEDFSSDETSPPPRLINRLRRTRKIIDFHSLSVGNHHNIADDNYPPFSARSSLSSSVNGLWSETCVHIPPSGECEAFCFICHQPRAFRAPIADTKEEGGSFNNFSLSPSSPPSVVPRNRPLPSKYGKEKEEAERNESRIHLYDDEVDSPVISTYHHFIPRSGEDFFFTCQQSRTGFSPVPDPKHEDGSISPESKLSILQDDNISPSPTPSPPPVLRPRNRPMPCEREEGEGEEDSDESTTILWDEEFDSPPVSPPSVLRPHNRLPPCEIEKRDDDDDDDDEGSEGSDESVIRLWVEDDSFAISPASIGQLRRDRPLLCNLRKRKEDEESDESTILWDEVPQSLRPRHRATTIPILTKGKGKEKEKGQWDKQEKEEGRKEERKEDSKADTKKEEIKEEEEEGETKKADTKVASSKEDRFGWAVSSLNDTADEEIWLSSGMNYPF